MSNQDKDIRTAAEEWVCQFNRIPQSVIEKLMALDGVESIEEITLPAVGDRVYIQTRGHFGEEGEVVSVDDSVGEYTVCTDGGDSIELLSDEISVMHDDILPMWGTMWSFGDSIDDWWLENMDGLRAMSDCGFRIYRQEDFGYIFGIDGAGYDFYSEHWCRLYKARGLQWHTHS